jgi:hypothetical protein
MAKVVYRVVKHDGGWAYKVDETFSEPFASHDLARQAAHRAAKEQQLPGSDTEIHYEDESGRWHTEVARGGDRPHTSVKG